jgi:glucose-6-phosphate 1-dehydrogenase
MPASRSDALVFFGATGDLAYKKIFPALQALGPADADRIIVPYGAWHNPPATEPQK